MDKGNINQGVLSPATTLTSNKNTSTLAPNATNFDNCFKKGRDCLWYFERENRPESMIDYQLNSPEYKNMVYVQRNLIYKNYVPLLKKLRIQAIRILYKIDQKLN